MEEQNMPAVDRITPMHLEQEMKTSFISYAMSVIIDRALPDVRDGLKPVHRRILFDMHEQGITADKPTKKSAATVGDVLGKYHPHGDSSVYDAMVRLAQPFNMRYPLVDPKGNFGSVDGDGAAAMRYTEARLSRMGMEMLTDLNKNTVDMYPNFDESRTQPTVLPCRFPNLLCNGSGGIAVGMATNVPPHNLTEVVNGLNALIDDPDITVEELMRYIPGPDFPTGGLIMGSQGIAQAYRTGRGRIVMRAKSETEQLDEHHARIVVKEIPYQVNKARLVESIAQLVKDKKIEGIAALNDETSDRTGMRIVIDLKKDVNPGVVLNLLYKHTQMQDTFGAIMLALVDGEPKVLTLKDMLYHYLEHQKDVVTRRTKYDLEKAEERLHVVEGLLIALDNIDEVVSIIRSSKSSQEAKERLTARFGFTERQTDAILDMRLQRLVGLERDRLAAERDGLVERIAYLKSVLADEKILLGIIRDEVNAIRDKYGDERRTEITPLTDDIDLDDIIEEAEMCVTMTHLGYIKRLAPDTYRAQNRGGRGVMGQGTREEDFVERLFISSTHSYILFFTNTGRVFKIKCYQIPEANRSAKGLPVVNLLQLQGGEKITATIPLPRDAEGGYLFMATKGGVVKRTALSDFDNIRKGGIIAINLKENDELIRVEYTEASEEYIPEEYPESDDPDAAAEESVEESGDVKGNQIMIATRNGRCCRFYESAVRPMGRSATGVRGILLTGDDEVVDMTRVLPGSTVLTVTENGMGKRSPEDQYGRHGRGGKGYAAMNLTEKTGKLVTLHMATEEDDLMLIRDDGTVMRTPVSQISTTGRATQGVKIMRVDDGTRIVATALVPHQEEEEAAPAPEAGTEA